MKVKSFNVAINNEALNGKELPTKLRILAWGRSDSTKGPIFLDEKTLSTFDAVQKKNGRLTDVPIDFDHCTVPDSTEYVAGKVKSIAGYGDPVLIKNDGLYLYNIQWTDLGKENARNYKDLSPAVLTDKDGTVMGLHSIALTPVGSIETLNFYSASEEDMIKKMSTENKEELDNSNKIKTADANEAIKHDDKNADCMCAECMAADKVEDKEFSTEKVEEIKTKAMSAETKNSSFPDAYKAQMPQYNTMNDTVIKQMAADIAKETGMENTDAEKVLFAFLAKFQGELPEVKGQITHKENTNEGGLKQFAAKFEALEKEIDLLKNENKNEVSRANDFERQTLVKNASKEGKIIPLSADEIKSVEIGILRSIVEKQIKNTVPMTSTLRVLSVDASKKPSRQAAVEAFDSMVKSA